MEIERKKVMSNYIWTSEYKAAKYFKGIYYDKGNLPIVNLFVPLEVTKHGKR
jgi:hypothetical protein